MKIYIGNYDNCKSGNLISISMDKGESVGYFGDYYTKLAPKFSFFREWENNIGIIDEYKNNKFYMEKYYETVISKLDANEVLSDLSKFGDEVILLCYEPNGKFCHRYLVAAWLENELNMEVKEVTVLENGDINILNNYNIYKTEFNKIIKEHKHSKKLLKRK